MRKIFNAIVYIFAAIGFSGTLLILYYLYITSPFEIDKCLDEGGRWNYETGECER